MYNQLLEKINESKEVSRNEIQHHIVTLKNENPELKKTHSKTLQYECYRIFSNIKGLSNSKKNGNKTGRLRFKGKRWFKTITYNQTGYNIIERPEKHYDHLKLSKIGTIKIRMHRKYEGNIKGITIKRKVRSWQAHIITDAKYEMECGEGSVGIDLGIKSFIATSNNEHYENPLYLRENLEKVRTRHREIIRSKKGSNNREKQKLKLERIHEKIADKKNDFMHKLTTKIVRENSFIAVEDLNISEMVSNKKCKYHNHRNIMDSSWGRFIQMLELKAESAGAKVVRVNPRHTSMKCNSCGNIQNMPLYRRLYSCRSCGLNIDRDYNASLNILGEGLAVAEGESSDFPMIQEAPSVRAV